MKINSCYFEARVWQVAGKAGLWPQTLLTWPLNTGVTV